MNQNALAPARDPKNAAISCVVPAYNEAANLPRLLEVLTAQLRALVPRWEIVIVDDGSRDDSAAAIAPWLTTPGVRLLRLSRNFGKEAALSAGIDHARGDVVVLMDADLQHPPAMIGAMPFSSARVHQSPMSSKSHMGRVCPAMKAIVLPASSAEPPPNAMTPSCPPAR